LVAIRKQHYSVVIAIKTRRW